MDPVRILMSVSNGCDGADGPLSLLLRGIGSKETQLYYRVSAGSVTTLPLVLAARQALCDGDHLRAVEEYVDDARARTRTAYRISDQVR